MKQSQEVGVLALALAKAQGEIKNPTKNKEVTVRTKTGGSYNFSYADLTAIVEAMKQPFAKNELAYVQGLELDEQGKFRLHTRIMHSSGQWIESAWPLFVESEASQAFGSALTFMKRYALAAMVGIVADDDDDGNIADGNSAMKVEKGQRKPKEPAPSPMERPQAAPKTPPHAIPVPTSQEHGGRDWPAWGKLFIDHSTTSDNEKEADAWLVANQESLHTMLDEAPKVFSRLKAAVAGVFPQLLLNEVKQ